MEAEERRNLEQLPCEVNCFPFPSPPENLLLSFQALCVTETPLQASIVLTEGPRTPLSLSSLWASSTPDILCTQCLVLTLYGKDSGFVSVIALSCAGHTVGAQLWAG